MQSIIPQDISRVKCDKLAAPVNPGDYLLVPPVPLALGHSVTPFAITRIYL